jgi:hypothetical protein
MRNLSPPPPAIEAAARVLPFFRKPLEMAAPEIEAAARVLPFRKPLEKPNIIEVARRRGLWPFTREEYMAAPEMERIRARAKKEWGYRCLLNVNHRGPVEMHHRKYPPVPFAEDWRDLIPLCEPCHERFHDRLLTPPIGLFDELLREAA